MKKMSNYRQQVIAAMTRQDPAYLTQCLEALDSVECLERQKLQYVQRGQPAPVRLLSELQHARILFAYYYKDY